jgi:hypothetical protein
MWTVFLSMITREVKGLRTKFNICSLPDDRVCLFRHVYYPRC